MLVLATSTPVTGTKEKAIEIAKVAEFAGANKDGKESKDKYLENLAQVPCIRYPINFGKKSVPALLNLGSKINTVHLAFTKELGLPIRPTDVGVQKIDGTTLDTNRMIVAVFLMKDKANWVRFFEETFLMANVNPKIILKMLFLTLSSANVDFLGCELRWKIYTTKEAFSTTKRIKLVGKKEFTAAVLNLEHEIYIVHVRSVSSDVSPSSFSLNIYPFWRPQISGLIAKEAPTKVSAKYLDFADVFSPDLASKLPKHTRINDHTIKLVDSQQPSYRPLYNLGSKELETLKAYIKTNLANSFIRPSKSPPGTPILFDWKSNGFLWLCVNYWGLNNLTIKNRYLLLQIGELLDRLERARRFTQHDLTSAYHQMRICKENEWKTVFKTWYSHFKYQVMPFGLTNTPASFQVYINKIFAEKLDIFVIVYLDDIFIYTDDDGNSYIAVIW